MDKAKLKELIDAELQKEASDERNTLVEEMTQALKEMEIKEAAEAGDLEVPLG